MLPYFATKLDIAICYAESNISLLLCPESISGDTAFRTMGASLQYGGIAPIVRKAVVHPGCGESAASPHEPKRERDE